MPWSQLVKFNYHNNTLRKLSSFPLLPKMWCSAQNLTICLKCCPELNPTAARLLRALPQMKRVASSKVASPSLLTSNDISLGLSTAISLSLQLHKLLSITLCSQHTTVSAEMSMDIISQPNSSFCPLLLPFLLFHTYWGQEHSLMNHLHAYSCFGVHFVTAWLRGERRKHPGSYRNFHTVSKTKCPSGVPFLCSLQC